MYTPLAQRFSKSLNSIGNQQIVDPLGVSVSYQCWSSKGGTPMRTHRANPRGYEDSRRSQSSSASSSNHVWEKLLSISGAIGGL
jgi:hypothetical protein